MYEESGVVGGLIQFTRQKEYIKFSLNNHLEDI
jgi:hypothetical protein